MKIISCIYEDYEISYMVADKMKDGKLKILDTVKFLKYSAINREESIKECTRIMKENNCERMIYEDDFGIIEIGNEV